MAQSSEEHITNPDGHHLFTKTWISTSGPAKAVAFIVHGLGEHCLHYEDSVVPALANCGCTVHAHDHFGHGHSDGDLSDLETFDNFSRDLIFHINQRLPLHPGLPVFLVGHSLGGLIAIESILQKTDLARGVVLIAPAVTVSREAASPLRISIARMAARFCPNVVIARLDATKVTRNKEHVKRYVEDPLVHTSIRAGFAMKALSAQEAMQRRLPEVSVPILVLHGTSDYLTDLSGSHLLMKTISSEDKTLEEYPDAYHQVHHEPDGVAESALKTICDWIDTHL